jgi:DNA-binding response OmpR family regulator
MENAKANSKILIVEDEKEFSRILKENLQANGFDVVVALNGQEGLEMIEKEKPDLVLLDIMMPKMNGIEMAKRLVEKSERIPIIFLTNMKDEINISKAIEAVPNTEYIIKSDISINSIIERIKLKLKII